MAKSYLDLLVWQEAMSMAEQVYAATRLFPREELYGLVSQMRRAAVSIPSNIAEGQGRKTRGEFVQFLGHSRGSLAELGTQLILAERLKFLGNGEAAALHDQISKVGQLLNGLIASLTKPRE